MNEDTYGGSELDWLSSQFLIANVGAPFLIGLAVGFFAKKMLKFALFLAGAAIVILFLVEYYGVTTVSDQELQNMATRAGESAQQFGGFLMERLSKITSKGVSATVGFFAGLKLG